MNARQVQDRFESLRLRHSNPAHQRREPDCDACFAISVVRTAVYRDWDPFTGVPYQHRAPELPAANVLGPEEAPAVGDMVVAVHMVTAPHPVVPAGWRTLAVVHPPEDTSGS